MLELQYKPKDVLRRDNGTIQESQILNSPLLNVSCWYSLSNFPIEVLFLRDDDIPQTVAGGVADLGIVGENEFVERKEDAEVIKRLGFSKCRLSLAIPKDVDYPGLSWFEGRKIATSYPGIFQRFHGSEWY